MTTIKKAMNVKQERQRDKH